MLTLDEYKFWVNSRKELYPEIIFETLNKLLELNPQVEKVWLTGSYLRGDWTDENTEEKYILFKNSITKKNKKSDIDFITLPKVSSTEHYDILEETPNKLLIYDNGKTII